MIDKAPAPSNNFSDLEKNQLKLKETQIELEKTRRELEVALKIIKNLEEERHVDSLTGLSNNPQTILDKLIGELNYFNESREIDESRESNLSAIGVAYIDMNRFKFINDTYGHLFGDRALVAFAERLKETIKGGTDLIFRPHGDEFIILFPLRNHRIISDELLERLFQRFEKRVNNNFFIKDDNGYNIKLSATMNYSILRKGETRTAEMLQHEADKKMQAKKKESREI